MPKPSINAKAIGCWHEESCKDSITKPSHEESYTAVTPYCSSLATGPVPGTGLSSPDRSCGPSDSPGSLVGRAGLQSTGSVAPLFSVCSVLGARVMAQG